MTAFKRSQQNKKEAKAANKAKKGENQISPAKEKENSSVTAVVADDMEAEASTSATTAVVEELVES